MPRKFTYEQALVAHGWVALDPVDTGAIEKLFKKNMREGEERLVLSVLESAVEDFQKHVLARHPSGKKLFREAEEWFLEKNSGMLFSFESICETSQLDPNYIRKGLLVWKEARIKLGSVDGQRPVHPKLARSRIKHPSTRLSKTA
jgi:hypothetical protein